MFFKNNKEKAAEKIQSAQNYAKNWQLTEAVKLLYEASELEPDNAETFLMIGQAEQNLMNNLGAIAAYQEVVKLNANDHEAWTRMAACLLELQRLDEAQAAMQKAMAIFQQQNQPLPKPYQDVANAILLFKGRHEAEREFKQNPMTAVRLEEHPEAFEKFKALQKSTTLQLNDVDNLLQEYPNITDLFFWRGSLLLGLGMVEKAIYDFTRAICLTPTLKSPHIERAKLWLAVNRFAEALSDTEVVIKLEPDNPEIIVLRAIIFETKGDMLSANRENEKLLSMDFSQYPDARIHLQQANIFAQHKRFDEAIRVFGQVLARPNLSPDVAGNTYYYKGKLFMNLNRKSEAVDCASKAVELMPNIPDFCHLLGEAGKQSGRKADEIRGWEAYVAAVKGGAKGFLPLYVAENFLREAQAR